jgi:hypothetical protein
VSTGGGPTFARIGAGPGGVAQIGAEPYVARHAAPDVTDDEAGPSVPARASARSITDAAPAREPSPVAAVEGRLLDTDDFGAPAAVDESNLTYDSAGRRVFVVFTRAGNVAPDRSPAGAS